MSKEFLRMQRLAGLITENQYKKSIITENWAGVMAARNSYNKGNGSGWGSESEEDKEKTELKINNKINNIILTLFKDIEKNQDLQSEFSKIDAEFNKEWEINKERYEKTNKWNPTRQKNITDSRDSKKIQLLIKKADRLFPEDKNLSLSLKNKLEDVFSGKIKLEDLTSPSTFSKIKNFFGFNKK